jgi:hypothetical protein
MSLLNMRKIVHISGILLVAAAAGRSGCDRGSHDWGTVGAAANALAPSNSLSSA